MSYTEFCDKWKRRPSPRGCCPKRIDDDGFSSPPPPPLGAFSHSAGTAPLMTLFVPGTPLQTTHRQKRT